MFDQTLNNVVVRLMTSHKQSTYKRCTNVVQTLYKRAGMVQWILGRFDFSQTNSMRLAKKSISRGIFNNLHRKCSFILVVDPSSLVGRVVIGISFKCSVELGALA